jgi:hypothetical protein
MNTPDMVKIMWDAVSDSGTQDLVVTWRASDGRTRVGHVIAEYVPHTYSVRVRQSWRGQMIPTTPMTVYADEISYAQFWEVSNADT